MATRRVTKQQSDKVTETPVVEQPKKSMWEKAGPVMGLLLIVAAFALGSMWTKMKYLEQAQKAPQAGQAGAGNAGAVAPSKYKNLAEAFKDYAKELKIDGNKLVSCMKDGGKTGVVQADADDGAKVGVQGTPAFFINGRLLAGAYPFEEFKKIIDEELSGNPKPTGARVQVAVGSASTKGSGSVTMIEYSDFQCPFCSRSFPTVQQILKEYGGKVLFAYKHFPLSQIHPNAQKAAEAAECAKDQGKFWEFHDKLFEDQANWAGLAQT